MICCVQKSNPLSHTHTDSIDDHFVRIDNGASNMQEFKRKERKLRGKGERSKQTKTNWRLTFFVYLLPGCYQSFFFIFNETISSGLSSVCLAFYLFSFYSFCIFIVAKRLYGPKWREKHWHQNGIQFQIGIRLWWCCCFLLLLLLHRLSAVRRR